MKNIKETLMCFNVLTLCSIMNTAISTTNVTFADVISIDF